MTTPKWQMPEKWEEMKNFYSYRIKDPKIFMKDQFFYGLLRLPVFVVWGSPLGTKPDKKGRYAKKMQSLRFPRRKGESYPVRIPKNKGWRKDKAQEWIKKHPDLQDWKIAVKEKAISDYGLLAKEPEMMSESEFEKILKRNMERIEFGMEHLKNIGAFGATLLIAYTVKIALDTVTKRGNPAPSLVSAAIAFMVTGFTVERTRKYSLAGGIAGITAGLIFPGFREG